MGPFYLLQCTEGGGRCRLVKGARVEACGGEFGLGPLSPSGVSSVENAGDSALAHSSAPEEAILQSLLSVTTLTPSVCVLC